MTQRVIAHLDMDAFYASVELLRYPELKGLPVVIGGGSQHAPAETVDPETGETRRKFASLRGYTGRGVITTATYAARKLGLCSAMGLMKAAAIAPDAVLLPTDFERYRRYSRQFKAAVRELVPQLEDRGIDEIYLDFTERVGDAEDPWECARELAQAVKQAVKDTTGLACSIGVTPNKLLSKIASDLDKPDGLTVLNADNIPSRIWPLPPRKINGVGPKAAGKLEDLGITSIGQLAQTERAFLVAAFGKSYGNWLYESARGQDDRPVVTASEPVSISRETTFGRDLHPVRDREELSCIFTELCQSLTRDLQRKGYVGKTIGLKLRYEDFRTVTRARTLESPTQDAKIIRRAAGECLKRVNLDRRIRLLGVRASGLESVAEAEMEPDLPLFD